MVKHKGGSPKLGTKGKKMGKHMGKGLKHRAPAEGARGRTVKGGSMDSGSKHSHGGGASHRSAHAQGRTA